MKLSLYEDNHDTNNAELIYAGKNVKIYAKNEEELFAIGPDNYYIHWYFDDRDSGDKLFNAFKDTNSTEKEFLDCLKVFGYITKSDIKSAGFDQYLSKLTEEAEVESVKQYNRYTFNIQCLPTDDWDVDSVSMYDVPQNVLDALADEIRKYPKSQIIIHNNKEDE